MKILLYSQHVLGMGHLFRSLELARAFAPDEVLLVCGGRETSARHPDNVREIALPALSMDAAFQGLHAQDGADVEEVKNARRKALLDVFARERPDAVLLELFPFGRKKFRFELEPLLAACRAATWGRPVVACSLRDILVERHDGEKYERRVLDALKAWFDVVLVHSDPAVQRLGETFPAMDKIPVPVFHTGFVAQKPSPGAREKIRRHLKLGPDDKLIIASAGGGQVGFPLLSSVVEAFDLLRDRPDLHLRLFTGPFMDETEAARLMARARRVPRLHAERFSPDLLDLLAAADLSISQAGYNTCMNILAARVPALALPFAANEEQSSRIAKLSALHPVRELFPHDLFPQGFAALICETLTKTARATRPAVDLDGAEATARLVRRMIEERAS